MQGQTMRRDVIAHWIHGSSGPAEVQCQFGLLRVLHRRATQHSTAQRALELSVQLLLVALVLLVHW
jgi:hypothetical protein